jgi:hypothetical protein
VDLAAAWGVRINTLYQILNRQSAKFTGFVSDVHVTSTPSEDESWHKSVNEQGMYLILGAINTDRLKDKDVAMVILRFQRWVPELIQKYRKREIAQVPVGPDIRAELEEARDLAMICGKSPESFQAVILKKHGKGELAEVLQPALVHGEPGQWLNPSEIGHECGLTAQQVNYWMLNHGFQYRDGPLWRLTPKGMDHGEEYVFEATSRHSEIRIRWHRSVLIAAGLKRDLALDQVMLPQKSQY